MAGDLPPRVLTLVLTVEYNGFQYAGFQRQSATPDGICDGGGSDGKGGSRSAVAADANCNSRFDCNSRLWAGQTGAESSAGQFGTGGNGSKQKRSAQDVPSQLRPNKRAKKNTAAPITVQHQIELALKKWTGLSINTLRVRGAGRTDKGVHASGQVVAFDVPLRLLGTGMHDNQRSDGIANLKDSPEAGAGDLRETLSEQCIPLLRGAYETLAAHRQSNTEAETSNATTCTDQWQIRRAITTRLPSDIAIRSARVWTGPHPFEARQGISRKTYVYRLRFRQLSYLGVLIGNRDFYNFVHKEERKRADKCSDSEGRPMHEIDLHRFDMDANEVVEEDPTLPPVINATFTLEAAGFRRSMVRNLVGFVVDVARGQCSADDIPLLLREKGLEESDGTSDGKALASRVHSAPACGLCLAKVKYDDCFL